MKNSEVLEKQRNLLEEIEALSNKKGRGVDYA